MFLVRAENSQGMSLPSGVSELARTLSLGAPAVVPHQLDEARSRLATRVINLSQLTALSSSSVKLTWDVSRLLVLKKYDSISFILRFRSILYPHEN
jgi:hypothetical protein